MQSQFSHTEKKIFLSKLHKKSTKKSHYLILKFKYKNSLKTDVFFNSKNVIKQLFKCSNDAYDLHQY